MTTLDPRNMFFALIFKRRVPTDAADLESDICQDKVEAAQVRA